MDGRSKTMIGLEEAKAIIHGSDPEIDSEQYSEIDAQAVFEEGWEHLGEDFYYDRKKKRIAGPSGGSPIRILVDLGAGQKRISGIERSYGIEMDIQSGPGTR